MTTENGIKRKLCRDLPKEKGEAFEVWNKELLDAGHGEGDEDASWTETYLALEWASPQLKLAAVRSATARQRRHYSPSSPTLT